MTDTMNRFALESVRYEHSQKHMFHIQTFRKQNKTKKQLIMSVLHLNIFQIILGYSDMHVKTAAPEKYLM